MSERKSKTFKILLTTIVLVLSCVLLFANLGYYNLWDDEAQTALFAQSVWNTGDTYAFIGKNFLSCVEELDSKFRNRYSPRLQFYLAAPFVGIWGNSSFAARFPFACCGLLTIALIFLWLHRSNASKRLWILISMGILGNVSLFLFFRQCRYYAPTILFATLLAYFYYFRRNSIKSYVSIAVAAIFLLFSNHLCAVAVYSCLIFDYLIWGGNSKPSKKKHLLFVISLVFLCAIWFFMKLSKQSAFSFMNPYCKLPNELEIFQGNIVYILKRRLFLFLMNLRELNTHELGPGLLLLLSPIVYFKNKNNLLLRCVLVLVIYCFVIAAFSPQIYNKDQYPIAEGRYLAPLILLCILTAALCLDGLLPRSRILIYIVAAVAFCTNIFNGGTSIREEVRRPGDPKFRSTILAYVNELRHPLPQSTLLVTQWVNKNLPPDTSIAITPFYQRVPLMFHAPQMIYPRKLSKSNMRHDWRKSPKLRYSQGKYIFGPAYPDYIIVYATFTELIDDMRQQGVDYKEIDRIDVFWIDLSKPELFWHSFKEWKYYNKYFQAVRIYKRISD